MDLTSRGLTDVIAALKDEMPADSSQETATLVFKILSALTPSERVQMAYYALTMVGLDTDAADGSPGIPRVALSPVCLDCDSFDFPVCTCEDSALVDLEDTVLVDPKTLARAYAATTTT